MVAPIPTTEPDTLIAGDTAKWLLTLADYPASAGWTLSYTLANASTVINFNASASGDDFLVNVPAATTAAWAKGTYAWRSRVSLAGEIFTVGIGTIVVAPSFASAVENRSHARKVLDNINAYLENSGNLSAAKYEIAGRTLMRYTLPELIALRDRYVHEVAREDAASNAARGLPDKRRVFVRFGA